MRIIVLGCMHHRQDTVKYCLDKMPFIDKVMIYTTEEDGLFLDGTDVIAKAKYRNEPLSYKWNAAVMTLQDLDFDAVILLGSDDYIDEKFLDFARANIGKYDMIGFTDLYFQEDDKIYYWGGYEGARKGEPSGAGKIYSKAFLERIRYNLFAEAKNRGLDGISWKRVKQANASILLASLKEKGLFLCDVKDGEGMTKIEHLSNLQLINN